MSKDNDDPLVSISKLNPEIIENSVDNYITVYACSGLGLYFEEKE